MEVRPEYEEFLKLVGVIALNRRGYLSHAALARLLLADKPVKTLSLSRPFEHSRAIYSAVNNLRNHYGIEIESTGWDSWLIPEAQKKQILDELHQRLSRMFYATPRS